MSSSTPGARSRTTSLGSSPAALTSSSTWSSVSPLATMRVPSGLKAIQRPRWVQDEWRTTGGSGGEGTSAPPRIGYNEQVPLFDFPGGPTVALTFDAIYENGVLKPTQPLPLQEHE